MRGREGMTLLEVLIAVILVSGALAGLVQWGFKAPWNQGPKKALHAQLLLEDGLEERLRVRPEGPMEERIPKADGWTVIWRRVPLPEAGWMLHGQAIDVHGKVVREYWGGRWWP